MRNPKEELTERGYQDYLMHIWNMRKAVEYFRNHDDLHIGSGVDGPEHLEDTLWLTSEELLDQLEHGPFTEDE